MFITFLDYFHNKSFFFFLRTLSQQILSDRLLLTITERPKSYFSSGFKLKSIITYHIDFFCKNIVNVAIFQKVHPNSSGH